MDRLERQIAPTLEGIRADHKYRYEWAARHLQPGSVCDVGAGIGYGSYILACSGFDVVSIENNAEAVQYGQEHYSHERIRHVCADANNADNGVQTAMFEFIEHVENPLPILEKCGDLLLASVPNESVVPYSKNNRYHFRHYTKQEFDDLLSKAGFTVTAWYGQRDIFSDVEPDMAGQTLVAVARR